MKILLASASPRRKDLLTTLGHDVVVIAPNVVELSDIDGARPEEIALINAQNKARHVFLHHGLKGCDFILGADTVVVCHGQVFGKPKHEDDAFVMLTELSKGPHTVITSFCLIGPDHREIARGVSSTVEFRVLTSSEIHAYLLCGEWHDKAGAYAVQGFGSALIRQVTGSITNVIGLPLDEVMADAQEFYARG